MNAPDLDAAVEVLTALRELSHQACLIDGVALQRWGQPRLTTDVDVSVLAPFGAEDSIIKDLVGRFQPRVANAEQFAADRRVLLIKASNGVSIDVALAAFPFEIEALERATPWIPSGTPGFVTCSAEDLVLYKLVAARGRDLADMESIVRRQGSRLDVDRIRRWGREFADLKEDPDLLRPFEDALRKARAGAPGT